MTSDLRTRLKQAIDAHKRERLNAARAHGVRVCSGCGCDPELRTIGCRRCSDRHRKWALRADPAFLEYERLSQQRARARRRTASLLKRSAGSSEMVASLSKSRRPNTPPVESVVACNHGSED